MPVHAQARSGAAAGGQWASPAGCQDFIQVAPLSQDQLGTHEVHAADLLAHCVLNLEAGVDLQEHGRASVG